MSLFLGVLSAAVTLNDSDYQNKLAGLENSSKANIQNKKMTAKFILHVNFWSVSKQYSRVMQTQKMEPMIGIDEEGEARRRA